jgi:hypothetical protein
MRTSPEAHNHLSNHWKESSRWTLLTELGESWRCASPLGGCSADRARWLIQS